MSCEGVITEAQMQWFGSCWEYTNEEQLEPFCYMRKQPCGGMLPWLLIHIPCKLSCTALHCTTLEVQDALYAYK
jgi:hypothetical protein